MLGFCLGRYFHIKFLNTCKIMQVSSDDIVRSLSVRKARISRIHFLWNIGCHFPRTYQNIVRVWTQKQVHERLPVAMDRSRGILSKFPASYFNPDEQNILSANVSVGAGCLPIARLQLANNFSSNNLSIHSPSSSPSFGPVNASVPTSAKLGREDDSNGSGRFSSLLIPVTTVAAFISVGAFYTIVKVYTNDKSG